MSDTDIRGWLWLLARSRDRQIAIVEDLMENAGRDRMIASDRTVCKRALRMLGKPWREDVL